MNDKEFALFYKSYLDQMRKNSANLDITYRCPLECPFCQRQKVHSKEKISRSSDITTKDYLKLINFFRVINFCGQISDPIYHPAFLDIVKLSSTYKDKVFEIHTNGTRKKLSWWKEVFEYTDNRFTWFFGLDGTDQDSANTYRINTKFDEVFEVMKLGASMGKNIYWQFIVFNHNEHQLEEAKQMAKENNIKLILMKSFRWEPHQIVKEPSYNWKSKYTVVKQIIPIEVI